MARTENIVTRVEPEIKEQAELILEQLGISMSTAMSIYLRQIVLQRKIPFEMKLPEYSLRNYNNISDEDFNRNMESAFQDYKSGNSTSLEDFEQNFKKDLKL